jgi:hypothetical protein
MIVVVIRRYIASFAVSCHLIKLLSISSLLIVVADDIIIIIIIVVLDARTAQTHFHDIAVKYKLYRRQVNYSGKIVKKETLSAPALTQTPLTQQIASI